VQFGNEFDLARLAPKREKSNPVQMLRPAYFDQQRGAG